MHWPATVADGPIGQWPWAIYDTMIRYGHSTRIMTSICCVVCSRGKLCVISRNDWKTTRVTARHRFEIYWRSSIVAIPGNLDIYTDFKWTPLHQSACRFQLILNVSCSDDLTAVWWLNVCESVYVSAELELSTYTSGHFTILVQRKVFLYWWLYKYCTGCLLIYNIDFLLNKFIHCLFLNVYI